MLGSLFYFGSHGMRLRRPMAVLPSLQLLMLLLMSLSLLMLLVLLPPLVLPLFQPFGVVDDVVVLLLMLCCCY